MSNENILEKLRLPFHPSHVTWKPQAVSKDQTKAMACAYADLRAYQNRLDEVCGMDWSLTYTPWGENRIVCHLTINGVTRSSTGESDSQSERSEIGGTAMEAQAMKRACAMFGLGRYLYNLPSAWVEYDAQTKQFTDKAKAKLENIIVQHYRRAMQGAPEQQPTEQPKTEPTVQAGVALETLERLQAEFDQLGSELYAAQWVQVSRHNIERITSGAASTKEALTAEQLNKLIDGMRKLQSKRTTATNGATGK